MRPHRGHVAKQPAWQFLNCRMWEWKICSALIFAYFPFRLALQPNEIAVSEGPGSLLFFPWRPLLSFYLNLFSLHSALAAAFLCALTFSSDVATLTLQGRQGPLSVSSSLQSWWWAVENCLSGYPQLLSGGISLLHLDSLQICHSIHHRVGTL